MTKLIIQEFISARSVIVIISWIFLAMAIAVVGSLYYFLSSLDRLAETEIRQRMNLALKIERLHRQELLEEYSYWDEAYEKIVVEHDAQWIEKNSGDYLLEKNGFDFSVAVEEGNQASYLTKNEDAQRLSFDEIMAQGLAELMSMSGKSDSDTKAVSGYLLLGESLYLVAGGPFIDEETGAPRAGSYLALGTRMDNEYVNMLATNYQLFELKLDWIVKNQPHSMTLRSPMGNQIGRFSWKPYSPSRDIIPAVILVMAVFSLVIILVTRHILQKEQANRTKYEDKLYFEATRDALTKINNRRYFMEMGNKEFHLYKLLDRLFTVVVLDIDHFKEINDNYGHRVGDKALMHFTQLSRQGLRESDIFGRIGGEEFAIVLPDTNVKSAVEVANQIRTLLVENPLHIDGNTIHMTVSAGIVTLNKQANFEVLLDQADKALYQAKGCGRNRVMLYNISTTIDTL
ncbi:diguanylate cyclase [Photobacterium sp. SDRW27]|uniref:sensor domain-containing diguanylate cyclase n=1 Tax=Photobacterium obscurum TaxID=2829490 RepID=UPI002243A3D7|nr:diguanylate cyclase [Photobacterium obscurum]MCW8327885.1 diguanylate cyclase [Photobacterium obscurum]